MFFDHTEETIQTGKFATEAIDFLEINKHNDYVLNLVNGEKHIYRGTCVLVFKVENGQSSITIG